MPAQRWRRPKLGYVWYLTEAFVLFCLAFVLCYFFFRPPQGDAAVFFKDFVVPLLAVFLGALLAFAVESQLKRREQRGKDKTVACLAFVKLARLLNRLENIRRNYLLPEKTNPARAIAVGAILPVDPITLPLDDLGFLLPANADFLGDLEIAQDNANSVLHLLNERSRFHRDVVQQRLKAASLPQQFQGTRADIERIVGAGDLQEIENLTDQLFESLDSAVPKLLTTCEKLSAVIRSHFPEINLRVSLEDSTPP